MYHSESLSKKHENPFQMNKRGRRIVGTFAVGAVIVGGALIGNAKRADVEPVKQLTDEQIFDSQLNTAIDNGPTENDTVLGEFDVEQDRTIANAIIQEATLAGRSVDLHSRNDLISITLSANAFDKANGPSYQPEDTFVLFEKDVNNDGKKELLATPLNSEK